VPFSSIEAPWGEPKEEPIRRAQKGKRMSGRTRILIIVGVIVLVFAGIGAAIAIGSDDDTEAPITGVELEKASEAAITHIGGGTVTDTEIEDEDSYYEVEVTRDDGTQVDVQLDEDFNVVGTEEDNEDED
jgi:uncharacterized membrane protein YkoI